ncbi:F-box/WD repeat-containing protein sel-10-like [Watersipora subatra]|uniref:F-box/WD repeat-containing protein sel-10-like n=1 Tax=Watersipora subatra TaxID=2589382 RepID=UPI00355C0777
MKLSSEPEEAMANETPALAKYAILLKGTLSMGEGTTTIEQKSDSSKFLKEEESVSNRVAGFICKYILTEHRSCVTSMCVVHKAYGFDNTFLVSGGWDHRLCIWNLDDGSLHSMYKDRTSLIPEAKADEETKTSEWAADGVITCMQYNPEQNEIAYGSSDHMVYIRTFSPDGSQMPLLNTLQHDGEITALRWNQVKRQWVSGSDDGTIKVWSGQGMNDLLQTLSEKSAVTCLCIDSANGAIIAGLQNIIKVYDSQKFRLMQTNVGHTDSVRDVVHIPERGQYVSCSWDKTIRIWNEWKQTKKREPKGEAETDRRRRRSEGYE